MINDGYLRVASAIPAVAVADTKANADSITDLATQLDSAGAHIAVFPEMCLTGYTCGDLFHSQLLIDSASEALTSLMHATAHLGITIVVGLPVRTHNMLFNCAAVIQRGRLLGIVPKTYIPEYNEFYEKRWWVSGRNIEMTIDIAGTQTMLSSSQLFKIGDSLIGIEICEDLWTAIPPSTYAALSGADVILNLSASDALTGKLDYIVDLVKQHSARCMCAYAYASAGYGESSTDLVFDGIGLIAQNGELLAQNTRWQSKPQYVMADIDIAALKRDRMHISSFADSSLAYRAQQYGIVPVVGDIKYNSDILRTISPTPFVPPVDTQLHKRCDEITNIQAAGLARRLDATHSSHLVVGISGGLDSTLALLVAVKAFDRLNLDRRNILAVTMPGFGTTDRTYTNACNLVNELGATLREIPIADAVNLHFRDIGHDAAVHDVTYENSQARERTQILMDLANQSGGMVLGTGDLSELALGWATYNGDHMSMYGVNSSVPKTLVRYLVRHFAMLASESGNTGLATTLYDILDTPVSPELIPADDNGNITQITEDLVGPYELHDFFLYYTLRYGYAPRRIFRMAHHAFDQRFNDDTIKKWMKVFFRRFFNQQFKRSCMPDGPKVGSVCLSPRGDWRMPSDASAALWLAECDRL